MRWKTFEKICILITMTRIIISPPPPLVFLFCKIDEITKLDDEQKNLL